MMKLLRKKKSTYLRRSRIFQVPKLDMSHADSDKVFAVLSERDSLDSCGNFVAGNFDIVFPVPDIDDHVMLGPDGHNIFIVGRESL